MVIGIDFYGTISAYPRTFRKLSESFLTAGDQVYIISAAKRQNISILRDEIKKSKIRYTALEIIVFDDYLKIPELKLLACKRLGIRLLFDDREDTCTLLARHGVLTAQIR
jgi:hypothetical protein